MNGWAAILALTLVELHGPNGQIVDINPEQVVALREPRTEGAEGHFQKDIRCLVFTSDGKYTAVTEECATVSDRLALVR